MISLPFLKYTIKLNYKMWLLFTGILCGYMVFGLSAFFLGTFTKLLSIEIPKLNEFIAAGIYGSAYVLLPMVYEIIIGTRLIAGQIENGNMAYYLATQNSRKKLASTQSYFLLLSLFLMFFCTSILGIVYCQLWGQRELAIPTFLMLNLGVFCLHVFTSGISFLASCISNETKNAALIAGGVSGFFYLIYTVGSITEIGFLKYFTFFSLFSIEKILNGNISICWYLPILALIGLFLHRVGVRAFSNRDLPL